MRVRGKISELMSRLCAVDIIIAASVAVLVAATSPGPVGAVLHEAVFKVSVSE